MNEQMTMQFVTAITDCFKDDDDRELYCFPQISEVENANEIILSMFYAFQFVVNQFCNTDYDPLDFINAIEHLLFQKARDEINTAGGDDNDT